MNNFLKASLFTALILTTHYSVGQPALTFKNSRFTIAQFTDIHWIENGKNTEKNDSTLLLIRHVLKNEHPDLVIFTGDIVISRNAAAGWEKLLQPFAEAKVPFAVTFGNHDTETDLNKQKILALLSKNPYNLTRNDDSTLSGVGNCALEIKSENGYRKWLIYLFDSHAYTNDSTLGHYDWIKNDQIQWYRKISTRNIDTAGEKVPALAFFHIPLPEFAELKTKKGTVGNALESVSSPRINSGLFAAFVEMHDVKGVFVGHDHNNDYIGKLHNIWLGFGRKTGYKAAYEERLPRGARIITLNENEPSFKTYVLTLNEKIFEVECR
jgi:hypothetical protein